MASDDELSAELYSDVEDDYDEFADLDDAWCDDMGASNVKESLEDKEYEERFALTDSKDATKRLISDLKALGKSKLDGISASPVGDNLYLWEVKLFDFEAGSPLALDLQKYAEKYNTPAEISLTMIFPPGYPFSPPFIYVRKPRFIFKTGHVTIGGSICMELLTTSGWSPVNDIESVLTQIRSEMIEGGARIDVSAGHAEYTRAEAEAAFIRVARNYGWEK